MAEPVVIEVSYDKEHNDLEDEVVGALEDELPVTEFVTEVYREDPSGTDAEIIGESLFWGLVAAFCFFAGLSVGIILYYKRGIMTTMCGWLHRCWPKMCCCGRHDAILLNVENRGSDGKLTESGAEGGHDSSSDSDGEGTKEKETFVPKVTFSIGDSDGSKDEKTEGDQRDGEAAAAAAAAEGNTSDKENEEKNDDVKETGEPKKTNEPGEEDAKSSSSSSSSSDNEEDEKSVRHRKKGTAEATPEGEAAPPPEDEARQDPQE